MCNLDVVVKPYKNVPTIFVNEKPVSGLMHWHRYLDKEDVTGFSKAGVNFFSFLGNIDLGDNDERPVDDGRQPCSTMTPDYIDSVMQKILSANPDALVIPRFRMKASETWKASHPQSIAREYNLVTNEFVQGKTVTVGADEWIDVALAGLARSIEHCEKRWGDNIVGYHSGFGDCAEHAYAWGPRLADYNPEMLTKFRVWLKQKYASDNALQAAWQVSDVTFENAEFPSPERFAKFTSMVPCLLDPGGEQDLIDMMAFNSEHMAGLVVRQAKAAKAALRSIGSQKIFGAFYGYMTLPGNETSHYAHGHDAHEAVLRCEEIDFISAPINYSARQPGGVSMGQLAAASATLAGKLYYAEDDSGTHLTKNTHNTMPATAEQFNQIMTRGFLDVWRNGGTQWFMDLHGEGEHRDKEILAAVEKLSAFSQKHLDDRESTAEIAVFFSDKSLTCARTLNVLTGSLLEQQLNEICSIGASFDLFRIEDLPELIGQNRLGQYKFAIMLNLHVVSDDLCNGIEKHLKKDERSILWFHAPGIIDGGKFSPEKSNRLTGINCVMQAHGRMSLITEVLLDGKRFSYGVQRNIYPRLIAADPEATSLGYIVEGTSVPFRENSDGATLAEKSFSDHRSIWSASPNMPSGLLAEFAEQAGVHIYCKCGSQVFNTKNWIGVHAKWSGELNIKFPDKVTLYDAFTGELVVDDSCSFKREVRRGENIVLTKTT